MPQDFQLISPLYIPHPNPQKIEKSPHFIGPKAKITKFTTLFFSDYWVILQVRGGMGASRRFSQR